jgi:hypothetical protein
MKKTKAFRILSVVALLVLSLSFMVSPSKAVGTGPAQPSQGPLADGAVQPGVVIQPAVAVAGGPGFVSLNGLEFKPFDPTSTYTYSGVSLQNTSAYAAWFMAPVHLPQGATVNQMVVYYLDNDAGAGMDIEADLVYVPLINSYGTGMGSVTSSGAVAGTTYNVTSAISSPVVDNSTNSYIIQVYLPPSSQIRLMAVRIDYGYAASLPLVVH